MELVVVGWVTRHLYNAHGTRAELNRLADHAIKPSEPHPYIAFIRVADDMPLRKGPWGLQNGSEISR